jgi:hypothetical protein
MAEYYGKAFAEEPELSEINRDFKDYVLEWEKKYGGAGQAAQYVMEWYEAALADKDDTSVEPFSDSEFTRGKMFKFRYDPVTKDRLSYWDRSPMILALGKSANGKCELGLNLNFLPKEVRYWMVGEIFKIYKQDIVAKASGKQYRRAYEQEQVDMDFDLLRKNLGSWGLDFALRQYYIGKTYETSVVCYEDWVKMVMCNWDDYDGTVESDIQKLYQEFLVRARTKK